MKKKLLLSAMALLLGGSIWSLPAYAQSGDMQTDTDAKATASSLTHKDLTTVAYIDHKALTPAQTAETDTENLVRAKGDGILEEQKSLGQTTGDHLILVRIETDTKEKGGSGADLTISALIETDTGLTTALQTASRGDLPGQKGGG